MDVIKILRLVRGPDVEVYAIREIVEVVVSRPVDTILRRVEGMVGIRVVTVEPFAAGFVAVKCQFLVL